MNRLSDEEIQREAIFYDRFTVADFRDEIIALRTAIRKHRDQRGDNRCFLDDGELYSVLPEGYDKEALALHSPMKCWKIARSLLRVANPMAFPMSHHKLRLNG